MRSEVLVRAYVHVLVRYNNVCAKVQNKIINKTIVKRPVHLISEVIVLMSLTLP